jgi:EmrB/QacA subfamily drug resistance transporter
MRRYFLFGIVSLTMLFTTMSLTVVAVAFPDIVTSFETSLIVAGWVLGANQLACTVSMPFFGKVGDIYGNKFTSILCLGFFTLGSMFCALAPNIETLIFFRFMQGLGVGGFLPIGTSIIADQFPDKRQQFIGLLASVNAIGAIIGPNLGGWLTEAFGWQSTFWLFVPFGFAVLFALAILVPKSSQTGGKLDILGSGYLIAFISAIMIGISLMGNTQQGISWWLVGLLFVLGIALAIIFLRRQVNFKYPIIDMEILREKRFLASNIYNFILGFGLLAITNFMPLYAVSVFGMSTLNSGVVMTPRSIGIMISSFIASVYLVRWGYRKPLLFGTIVTAVSIVFMAFANPTSVLLGWQIDGFWLLCGIFLINGVAWGVTTPAANNACIELLPERVGTIVGVRGMFRQMGCTIGISLITLTLNNSISLNQGFIIVCIGIAILLLLSLPLVYMMPRNATVLPVSKGPK